MAKRLITRTAVSPSGEKLVKSVIYTPPMPRDTPQIRAARSKVTSKAQKKINNRHAYERLEMLLFCNFEYRDHFVTLTYAPEHEPQNRKTARECIRKFFRLLRADWKRRGKELKYIYVTENKHGEGRYHHHVIVNHIDRNDREIIISLWDYGRSVDVRPLFDKSKGIDYCARARYMTKENIEDRPNGAQLWTASKNLVQPEYESVFVPDNTTLELPFNAKQLEREECINEWSSYRYMRYLVPAAPPYYSRR